MTQMPGHSSAVLHGNVDPPPTPTAPMSFAQEQLWLLNKLIPRPETYNVPGKFRLRGTIDRKLFERVLADLMDRHEALRTAMIEEDGDLYQVVRPASEVAPPLEWCDLAGLPESERVTRQRRLAEREARAPFVLERAPLWRAVLLRIADREHVLLLTMHHIITDGWSLQLLMEELCRLYTALAGALSSPLAPLSGSPAESALRQRELLRTGGLDRERAYWRENLAEAPPIMPSLAGRPRPTRPSYRGAAVEFELPDGLPAAVAGFGRRLHASPFMVYLAAFKALLLRYTGRTDIVVGTPVAGRGSPEEERLFGYFVNSLPLRTDLSGSPSFNEIIRRVRVKTLEALDHQALPFEEIVRESAGRRGISHHPVFQLLFAFTSINGHGDCPDLTAEPLPTARTDTAKFDLALMLYQSGQHVRGAVEFATDLFDGDRVERLVANWLALLPALLADPGLPVDAPGLPGPLPEDRPAAEAHWPAPPSGPDPVVTAPDAPDAPEQSELLAGIWAEVLGLPTVLPDQDFFELGGHSLLAMRITARVSAALDLDLPMAVLFQNPTLSRFATAVDAALAEAEEPEPAPISTSEGDS